MGDRSKIEWTDATWNPWIGCTKVSPGCDHCYAEAWDRRFAVSGHAMHWGAGKARRRTSESNWRQPVRWNATHDAFFAAHGRRRRVFCASLADVFDNEVPPEWRADMFDLIRRCENLDFLLLTKRIGNAEHMIEQALISMGDPATDVMGSWPWPNVGLGATVVNQEEADRDIPKLLATPARLRFLSIEPMLGPIDLTVDGLGWGVDWIIVGGESGPHARPMVLGWAKDIVRQCKAADVPVLVKQLGARPTNREGEPHPIKDRKGGDMAEWPVELRVREFPQEAAR